MSDTVIKVENVSKLYMVGHNAAQTEPYTALRDVIARNAKSFIRKTRDMLQGKAIIQGDSVEEFWALKDVYFEVKQGDRLGIIGRNGAGKSTLLKILSRITEPTSGRISINGRVASLLEVGTGFHPELTGRENIFLNGAILGMSRKEIQRKFDEIVDFAEVERFLDTPVKRYSSGMYVRLAFSVAAHLESEILVVDEVLAVGDTAFQQKCLGKMKEKSNTERTVLFVSHNLEAIKSLCQYGVLLKDGQLQKYGEADEVIKMYSNRDITDLTRRFPTCGKPIYISAIEIDGNELAIGNITVKIRYVNKTSTNKIKAGLLISTPTGAKVFSSNTIFHTTEYCNGIEDIADFSAVKFPMRDGSYTLSVWLGDEYSDYDEKIDVISFEFTNHISIEDHTKTRNRVGHIEHQCNWKISRNPQ